MCFCFNETATTESNTYCHTLSLHDARPILVRLAKAGQRGLRLKGGDPFVFGRGGEEALALVAAGVPFRIIPGISAGIGGLAYAGIPVTHRDTNSAVTFITGHGVGGAAPDGIHWARSEERRVGKGCVRTCKTMW